MYYITDTKDHVLMAEDYLSAEFLFSKLESCNVSYVDDYKGPAILYIKHPKYSRTSVYKPISRIEEKSLIDRYRSGVLASYNLRYTVYGIAESIRDSERTDKYTYEHLIDLENIINNRFSEIKNKKIVISADDEIIAEISNMNALFPVLTLYKFMSFENLKDILHVYNKVWHIIGW